MAFEFEKHIILFFFPVDILAEKVVRPSTNIANQIEFASHTPIS
jgi:hypothetical protein